MRHDTILAPPIQSDVEPVAAGRVAFAVPGDLNTPTGGYRYDRRIIEELERYGWDVDVVDLGSSFPYPRTSERAAALELLSDIPAGCPVVIDGLAFGALPEAGALRWRTPLIALVHQPLATHTGISAEQADAFHRSERAALSAAAHVVATSDVIARMLIADYAVPADRISAVSPGNDRAPQAHGSSDGLVRLASVGSIVPGKGYDLLIAALATLKDLPWRLSIAGDVTRDDATTARLRDGIASHGLADRVTVLGALPAEEVTSLYLTSDVFVLASRFESYGMALAEAIAHGLPVVSTTAGAIPDTVPADAGLLVPPDDTRALAGALHCLIADASERRRLAANARRAAARLPSWQDSARRFARAIEAACGGRPNHVTRSRSRAIPRRHALTAR
jgi:glycosyltransferase involved in cell wall biosynthesis